MSMSCPACGDQTTVYDSRQGLNGWWKRRRRCVGCMGRFTTLEMPVDKLRSEVELIVGEVIGNAASEASAKIYRRITW